MNFPKPDMEVRLKNKFFTAYKLYDGVALIAGLGGENCYLVEGSERALLIDGLTGVGSLKAFVRELTDLPVSLAITHGHVDHAGAAYEYGECFINPDDVALMYSPMHSDRKGRLGFVTGGMMPGMPPKNEFLTMDDVPPAVPVKTYPIYAGDIFDLGGVELEVVQIPGHTYGTVVFLDRARRCVYSGDACNANTLVGLDGSTTIEEYLESLNAFTAYLPAFDRMHGGHGLFPVPASIVGDAIALCEDILAGRDDAIETTSVGGGSALLALKRGPNYLPERGGLCDIVYRRSMLHKRPHPAIKGGPNTYR